MLLIVLGIAWIAVYLNFAKDAAEFVNFPGAKKPSNPLPWMSDLKRWNFLIGFLLIFLGLTVAAHKPTPLGRGRGVVIGMLGCFLIGLVWIVTFYFVGQDATIPVMKDLTSTTCWSASASWPSGSPSPPSGSDGFTTPVVKLARSTRNFG